MAEGRFVAYYRVSTDKQGKSGLGLEAQQEAVRAYLNNGGKWELTSEIIEIESGGRDDRPKLQEALRLCRLYKATLIIAKLDRLARNVHFISTLMEGGVEFTAVDFPQANRLTVHILAAVAEHERKMISDRTRAALSAAKARGVKLGKPDNLKTTNADRAKGRATRTVRAMARAADLAPVLSELKGLSLNAMAREMNERGIPTARGGRWTPTQVKRVLEAGR